MINTAEHTAHTELRIEMERHGVCVLIPTYNNAATLAKVIQEVLAYTSDIIVVNDGSDDDTESILKEFPAIQSVSYPKNKGKGFALQQGFRLADKAGYKYALVMDSDGQHYASDAAVFLERLDEYPGALLVGVRNMQVDNVPVKSNFGKRFSNFWYWVNTGIRLSDTQSGFRLYPLGKLAKTKWFTNRYEFEIEVLVRAAWKGILIIPVPISVYYPPAAERISHFRPFKDFSRISVLNTFLVLIALFYIKPRDFIRLITSRDGWRKIFKAIFVHPEESNLRKACSIGFGVFMGIVPIWGFQLAVGIPLALLFRLNKALFLLAANISIFPITPLWLLASIFTGKLLLGEEYRLLHWSEITVENLAREGMAFFLGGTVLAIVLGLTAFLLTYGLLALMRKEKE